MSDSSDKKAVRDGTLQTGNDKEDGGTSAPTSLPSKRISRRKLFKIAAGCTAAVTVAGAGYLATRRRINIAILGAGMRGNQHASLLRTFSYFMRPFGHVVAICDAQLSRAQSACNLYWPKAHSYQDYREVLARKDVEAVIICPCDHWHAQMAIDAMHAGKDVYGEKPLTLTIAEGQRLLEVAEKTKCVFQVGTQQRSQNTFRTACNLLLNGRIGTLKRIVVTLNEQTFKDEACVANSSQRPGDLDWNLWLGPTPLVEYCRQRHLGWSNWYDYSGGQITGWGSHHLDIGLWGMGNDIPGPVLVDGSGEMPSVPNGYDVARRFRVILKYPNGVEVEIKSTATESRGVLFEGTEGRVFANRSKITGKPFEELSSNPIASDAAKISECPAGAYDKTAMMYHYSNFFQCIETREKPISDLWSTQHSNTALHLCNLSIRLGRPIGFDPKSQRIIGDNEAESMTHRPRRSPFTL